MWFYSFSGRLDLILLLNVFIETIIEANWWRPELLTRTLIMLYNVTCTQQMQSMLVNDPVMTPVACRGPQCQLPVSLPEVFFFFFNSVLLLTVLQTTGGGSPWRGPWWAEWWQPSSTTCWSSCTTTAMSLRSPMRRRRRRRRTKRTTTAVWRTNMRWSPWAKERNETLTSGTDRSDSVRWRAASTASGCSFSSDWNDPPQRQACQLSDDNIRTFTGQNTK